MGSRTMPLLSLQKGTQAFVPLQRDKGRRHHPRHPDYSVSSRAQGQTLTRR